MCDDTTTRLCPYCEGPIRRPKGKTCGDVPCIAQHKREAARRSYQKRRAAGGPRRVGPRETRQCAWCAGSFDVFVSEAQRYCSLSCGNQGRAVHPHVPARRQHDKSYSTAVVKYTGPRHVAHHPSRRTQWWACTCRVCGGRFIHLTNSWACSSECLKVLTAETASRMHSLRRARLREAYTERFDRRDVFERDGYLCHLCGEMTAQGAVYPDMAMPTLDHVIPLSKGGDHTMENCKTAHFLCNSLKGNREDYVGPWIDLRANDPADRPDLSPVG